MGRYGGKIGYGIKFAAERRDFYKQMEVFFYLMIK